MPGIIAIALRIVAGLNQIVDKNHVKKVAGFHTGATRHQLRRGFRFAVWARIDALGAVEVFGLRRHEFIAYQGDSKGRIYRPGPRQIDLTHYAGAGSSARRGPAFVVLTELAFAALDV